MGGPSCPHIVADESDMARGTFIQPMCLRAPGDQQPTRSRCSPARAALTALPHPLTSSGETRIPRRALWTSSEFVSC